MQLLEQTQNTLKSKMVQTWITCVFYDEWYLAIDNY